MNDKDRAERDEAQCDAYDEAMKVREAALNKSEGESLSIEDLTEVYIQVRGD